MCAVSVALCSPRSITLSFTKATQQIEAQSIRNSNCGDCDWYKYKLFPAAKVAHQTHIIGPPNRIHKIIILIMTRLKSFHFSYRCLMLVSSYVDRRTFVVITDEKKGRKTEFRYVFHQLYQFVEPLCSLRAIKENRYWLSFAVSLLIFSLIAHLFSVFEQHCESITILIVYEYVPS